MLETQKIKKKEETAHFCFFYVHLFSRAKKFEYSKKKIGCVILSPAPTVFHGCVRLLPFLHLCLRRHTFFKSRKWKTPWFSLSALSDTTLATTPSQVSTRLLSTSKPGCRTRPAARWGLVFKHMGLERLPHVTVDAVSAVVIVTSCFCHVWTQSEKLNQRWCR